MRKRKYENNNKEGYIVHVEEELKERKSTLFGEEDLLRIICMKKGAKMLKVLKNLHEIPLEESETFVS